MNVRFGFGCDIDPRYRKWLVDRASEFVEVARYQVHEVLTAEIIGRTHRFYAVPMFLQRNRAASCDRV